MQAKSQIILTDRQSRITPCPDGGGFDQSYNARAAVDTDSMLIVATRLVDSSADAKQVLPMLEELAQLPEDLGRPETLWGMPGSSVPPTLSTAAKR